MVQVLWGPAQLRAALADQLEEDETVAIGEAVPDALSFRRRVSGVMVCTVGWGMESSSRWTLFLLKCQKMDSARLSAEQCRFNCFCKCIL
jgi:hypothetical protein